MIWTGSAYRRHRYQWNFSLARKLRENNSIFNTRLRFIFTRACFNAKCVLVDHNYIPYSHFLLSVYYICGSRKKNIDGIHLAFFSCGNTKRKTRAYSRDFALRLCQRTQKYARPQWRSRSGILPLQLARIVRSQSISSDFRPKTKHYSPDVSRVIKITFRACRFYRWTPYENMSLRMNPRYLFFPVCR